MTTAQIINKISAIFVFYILKSDFEMMFSKDDSEKLKEYHSNRVILIN